MRASKSQCGGTGCGHQRAGPFKVAEAALPTSIYALSNPAAGGHLAGCPAREHHLHGALLHTPVVIHHAHQVGVLDASATKMNLPDRLRMTIDEPAKMHLQEHVGRKMTNDEGGVPHR